MLNLSLQSFSQKTYLLVGTYTNTGSKGIYVYSFDKATGKVEPISHTDSVKNPSYLTVSADGKYVFAVNETNRNTPGGVSAFSFDKESGSLTFINQQPSGGDDPCYVTASKNGKWVVVGNYSGGNLSLLPVKEDGSLNAAAQLIQHSGNSANRGRQEKAHVHATVFSPDEKFLFTPDLGTDKVMVYAFNPAAKQKLAPAAAPFVNVDAGNGPRHFVFHPNHKFAYLIEELSGTVAVYKYANGNLIFLQRLATHPAGFKGTIGSADVHLSPDGKFLYASNRGDENTITIFSVNGTTGRLLLKGYQPTGGKTPRNFMIDKSGNYLLVANQETNNIVIFKRNKATGLLQATEHTITVPRPVCLKMVE